MNNKEIRKIQFGGYNYREWKRLRQEIRRRDIRELRESSSGKTNASKAFNQGSIPCSRAVAL